METSMQACNRKTCRACLRQFESRKELLKLSEIDQSANISFFDMLSDIMHQRIPENCDLPSQICIMCLSSLRVSYFFRQEVEKSQNSLLKQTGSFKFPAIRIKEEPGLQKTFPVISKSATVASDAFNSSNFQDLLQSDDEIIDYEPDLVPVAEYSDSSKNSSFNTSEVTVENGAFSCDECPKSFNSWKALQCHKRCSHKIKRCKYCNNKFGNKGQLKLHTKYKHADKYDEFLAETEKPESNQPVVSLERLEEFNDCSNCEARFASKIALVKHHAECDHKCIDCGLKIPRKDFYFKHLEMVHKYSSIDLTGYECPFCMNLFQTESILQDHIQRLHPDESQSNVDTFSEAGESVSNDGFVLHTCKVCTQSFHSAKSLKQHISIKHKELRESLASNDSILIPLPKLTTNVPKYTKDEFFEKFLVQKSNDYFRCVPCQKEIFRRSVITHIKGKHAAMRCYRCELCKESFFRTDYRQRHVALIHPNDYKCTVCNVQFDRAYKYEGHMTMHGYVQKKFKPDEGTDKYDLSHNDIKYIEDSTNYDYNAESLNETCNEPSGTQNVQHSDIPLTKDEFIDKYMTSISDKSIRCNICNVEMQKASIISHLYWKHAVYKPLKCAFCNERVVKNNARLAHMARCHPDDYKCEYCNQQFAKHQLLVDHALDIHGIAITTRQSTGEEEDLNQDTMRFVTNKNEDEIIEEEPENLLYSNSMDPPMTEKLHNCQFCPKKFTSAKNLLIHKSHKHKNDQAELLEPMQESALDEPMSFDEFRQNWSEFVGENEWKCLACDMVMKPRSFIPHCKVKHAVLGAYLCAVCPERFTRLDHRMVHMSQCHKEMFNCAGCNIQFHRNSRYAKHMSDLHGIEIDSYDRYETDLGVNDLKFVPYSKKSPDEDQMSMSSSVYEPEISDPMEEMMQIISSPEGMSRTAFIAKYIKIIGMDRHCLACDKVFYHSSIYHHLIHFHATILPFKCPFCDVRFERSVQRSKHLQYFHPNEYKCNECGLQFSKHIKYSEHMSIEHNIAVKTPKSPYEEKDISSLDLKYVAQKSGEETFWQDDENALANSTAYGEYPEQEESTNEEQLLTAIKTDAPENPTISYVADDSPLVELPSSAGNDSQVFDGEMHYLEFKEKYLKKVNAVNTKCLACNRIVLNTSVCAHLRLWHSTSMIFNCELCPAGFRRGDYRMRHMELKHPEEFKCSECNSQFYYSRMYRDHMFSEHKKSVNIQVLKTKDEMDVPLEKLKFAPLIPEEFRVHNPEETTKHVNINKSLGTRRRLSINIDRPSNSKMSEDQNERTGFNYKMFYNKFIQLRGDMAECKACKKTINKLSIKKHLKREHATSKPYYCQLCESGFFRSDDRLNHMKRVHPDSFKCLICDIQFYLSTHYVEHMSHEHSMNVNIALTKAADQVDIPFDRQRFIPYKTADFQSQKARTSEDDGMTREEFTERFIEKIRINGEPFMKCKACNKSFASKQKRFHLIHNHSKIKPFGCDLCSVRFMSNFKRLKHMESCHSNDFKCQICTVQFETADKYSQHMLHEHKVTIKVNASDRNDINGEDMRYFEKLEKFKNAPDQSMIDTDENSSFNRLEPQHCEICNIDFDSSRSYRQHVREHGGENEPIAVPEIPKKVEIKKERVEKEEEAKTFPCEFCDKVLASLSAKQMHQKYKHDIGDHKQKVPNQKFEITCEVCRFSTYRRDYIAHHMKASHPPEFSCPQCRRYLSTYNCLLYHVETNHYTKLDTSKSFKCSDCGSYFQLEENLKKHKESKHGDNPPKRDHFCVLCSMNFKHPSSYQTHLETYTHRNMESFFNGETSRSVKGEPQEKSTILDSSAEVDQSSKTLEENEQPETDKSIVMEEEKSEPEAKRQRLSENESVTENDKLEYLNFLQTTESGHFKCGICGKVKALRKYMLHHLKQHKEVPTYDCPHCPEQFVFKSKYDKHMELHKNGTTDEHNAQEHPKFQEVSKPQDISCKICNMTFKLTIIMNKHNSTWHSDDNPLKDLSMQEQKQKKSESSTKGDSKNETTDESLSCERCLLKFHDKKILEHHQKLFCIYRGQAASTKIPNEQ